MRVTYGFECFTGQLPYFSITGEIFGKRGMETCGYIHNEIRKHFPELANLIPFHLCDSNATPMHYVANAVYWAELAMGVGQWHGKTDIPNGYASFEDVLASHILADVLGDRDEMKDAIRLSKPDFKAWLESRMDKLGAAMKTALESHGITIPTTPTTSEIL
jgi:hypothetical protein